LEKNEEIEQSIPLSWRPAIASIVDDIIHRNLDNKCDLPHRVIVDSADAAPIYQTVDRRSINLSSLSDATWKSSVCRWMSSHWYLLIDMSIDEELSDLVLFIDLYEHEGSQSFIVKSLHVP
jgi:hypothetical protein